MGKLSDSRQYMEHYILMHLRNDQATWDLCTGVAMDAGQQTAMGDLNAPDHEIHHAAGEAVARQLIDWIDRIGERAGIRGHDGPAVTMLGLFKDLLDVGDSQLWESIGKDFLSDWSRPVKCRAVDCDQVATDNEGHCEDCVNLVAHVHQGMAGIMHVHDEDLEQVAATGRVIACNGCDVVYVAGVGWR